MHLPKALLRKFAQGSGSDIVIEEDLAAMFGRSLIEPRMASTFRTVIAKNASTKLCDGISLEAGPGPTTLRALSKNQTPYFSMVIQCSLLTSALEKASLATAIKNIFEKQAEDAPQDQRPRANPSEDGLLGVLQACSEQTSLFDWNNLLLAVAKTLDDPERARETTIPAVVFRGLATTLPLVQHFPEDRMLHIECGEGVCLIVVWAYHVLGLSLTIRTWFENVSRDCEFGPRPAQIFVDARFVVNNTIRAPSVTLLEVANGETTETIFKFEPDPDEPKIEALLKKRANGYGKAVLRSLPGINNGQEAVLNDMAHVTCAFAILMSRSLCESMDQPGQDDSEYDYDSASNHSFQESEGEGQQQATIDDDIGSRSTLIPVPVDEDRLVEAGKFLLGIRKLNTKTISQYVTQYTDRPLTSSSLDPPVSLEAALDEDGTQGGFDENWRRAVYHARILSILILAFAHVHDLESCAELPLNYRWELLAEHASANKFCHWDGKSKIGITESVWFHAIALLMVDGSRMQEERPALLSDRGWSIYLTTFGFEDPSHTDAGYVAIKPGTPHRNGVYKHIIIDGPDKGELDASEWQVEHRAGDKAALECTNTVTLGRPLCGERRDSFIVSLRMALYDRGSTSTRRAGYRELYHAIWTVQKTKSCQHPIRNKEKLTLTPGFATISGFGDKDPWECDERIRICLTAHNETARWRALLAIAHTRQPVAAEGLVQVMLRGNDCCFKCAIAQTSTRSGKWFIVL